MPHTRSPEVRAPAGRARARRPRALERLALALPALALAASTTTLEARADVIPANKKHIKATYEITGIDEHPDYLFVAFPYGGCPMGPVVMDDQGRPKPDIAWTNYEVLRSGRSYEPIKACFTRIYAFKASDFTTEERVLTRDLDFYRSAGYTLTIIKGFEELNTADKYKFVERSRSVFPSTINVNFPFLIDQAIPFNSTHDVLRVAAVTEVATRIEGVRVVVSAGGGETREIPYQNGQRPKEVGEMHEPEPPESSIGDGLAKALCAALLAVGFVGAGLAILRRSEAKKRGGSSKP